MRTAFHQNHHLSAAYADGAAGGGIDVSLCDDDNLIVVDEASSTVNMSMPSSSSTLFTDMMADLKSISCTIASVKTEVRVRRQRRATSAVATRRANVGAKHATRSQVEAAASPLTEREKRDRSSRRKKDGATLDFIYAELQESVGMCRYWGKKCWNLRVSKEKGGYHSLCHFHRVKANENQRRFDYKRRGTMWRCFRADPNYKDVSLFPGELSESQSESSSASYEPFESAVPLRDEDVELLNELVGMATV